jgi:hypothetical protein
MPVVKYQCSKGHVHKAIVSSTQLAESTRACHCGEDASRQVSGFGLGGQIFFDLMRAEDNLLGKNRKESFRDAKCIKAWEKDKGLVQCTAQEMRDYKEYATDKTVDQEKTIAQDGRNAWFDRVDREDIQEVTGWNTQQYNRWKEPTDEYESAIKDGTVTTETA